MEMLTIKSYDLEELSCSNTIIDFFKDHPHTFFTSKEVQQELSKRGIVGETVGRTIRKFEKYGRLLKVGTGVYIFNR
jgi:hypothetical protein